jgi:hypothetical protein
MATRIKYRRDTPGNWTSKNPVLAAGEPGYELGTKKFKIGDGVTAWAALPYHLNEGDISATYGTINGTSIQGYDIVILAGQSNMSGRGTAFSAATDPANPRIFQYKSKAPNANTIVAAAEPLDMHDTPTGIGPGLQFARWYAARKLVGNRKVLLVPVAHGGTPLVSTNALGWRRGVTGNLYANMVTQAQGALAAAGTGSRIVAALWLQGETDGDNGVTNVQYQTDFDALINGLRTDLSIPDLPFIVGTMVPEYLSTGTRPAVNAVHRDTPNRIARTDVAVSAVGQNNGDGNHFNAPGQRANGKAMFDAYERIMEGLAPYSESYVTPGQVTGLTAGAPGSASVPLTWSAVSGSTSYLMEYRTTGSGTWLNGGTSTGTSGTVSGLAGSTGYDFRVTASNSIASGTPSSTVTATTTAPVYALGVTAAQPLGAYSLRKVVPSYAGSAVLVRRSSDSTTQAIGFTSGSLDTASLLTFAGAGDAFVVTWYDQSGNGKHVTQATAGYQPKIVSAGAMITSGGKPVVRFDGVDDILAIGSSLGLYAAGAATAAQVASAAQPSAQKRAWAESVSTSSSPQYGLLQPDGASSGTWPLAFPVATGQISWNSPGLAPTKTAWNGAIHQMSAVDTGSAMSQWIDAAADVSSFAYTRAAGWAMNTFALGGVSRSGSTASFAVDLSELVLWPAALSTAQRQTAETDQKAFYGTP